MSASERLRELNAAMTDMGVFGGSEDLVYAIELKAETASAYIALRNALPLLADVVEAAEFLRDQDPDARAGKPLDAALTALREHLEAS